MQPRLRSWWARVIALLTLAAGGRPASAHTELESTTPAADELVATPVTDVTLVFTGNVAVVADGIDALDAAGQVHTPVAVTQPAGSTVVATFDPPLAGGAMTVRWSVGSSDGHVIDGTFAFTAGVAPATTVAPTTTVAPVPTAASTTVVPPSTSPTASTTSSTASTPATTDAPATTASATTSADADGDSGGGGLSGWGVAAIVAGAAVVAGTGAVAAIRYVPRR